MSKIYKKAASKKQTLSKTPPWGPRGDHPRVCLIKLGFVEAAILDIDGHFLTNVHANLASLLKNDFKDPGFKDPDGIPTGPGPGRTHKIPVYGTSDNMTKKSKIVMRRANKSLRIRKVPRHGLEKNTKTNELRIAHSIQSN